MSTEGTVAEHVSSTELVVGAGMGGGFVGGIGMGLILHGGAGMMEFIGALYGAPTVPAGWVAHLVNSVIIGLIFALVVSRKAVRGRIETTMEYAIAGMIYATAVGLATVGIMIPMSMRLLDLGAFPEPPLMFAGMIGQFVVVVSVAVAHLVYGVLLGITYRYIRQTSVVAP